MANKDKDERPTRQVPKIIVTDYDADVAAGKIIPGPGYARPNPSTDDSLRSKKTVTFQHMDDDDDSEEAGGDLLEKRAKFFAHWKQFSDRVKVHEMVKCLEAEYEKLQILRDRTNWDEIEKEKQIDAIRAEVHETDDLLGDRKAEKPIMLLKTLREEKDYLTAIYPSIKQAFADPKYISQSAARIFKTRANMSEDDVEKVMELCEDKIEQRFLRDALHEKRFREKYLQNASERRRMIYDFINSKFFSQFMLITIIFSVIGISLLTFEGISIRYGSNTFGNDKTNFLEINLHIGYPLVIMDSCIIGIFLVEAILKIIIYKEDYFTRMWNILDMLIIVTHFVDVMVDLITKTMALSTEINATIYFKFLKSLRALRLLRVIKFLPNLQVILSTVFESFLSLGSIAVLMALFIFVFAVMGKGLFSENSPEFFGTLWFSLITLFQLLTLDDWYKLLNNDAIDLLGFTNPYYYWLMFFYLFAYLILEYFVFLNLFVAVLVDNFQLSLAEAEFKRQRESLDFGDDQSKFEVLDEDGEGAKTNADNEQKREFELNVEDYFPVVPGSRENALIGSLMKDMASIDFESFMWNRRVAILNNIMDRALLARLYAWSAHDDEKEYLKAYTKDKEKETEKENVNT